MNQNSKMIYGDASRLIDFAQNHIPGSHWDDGVRAIGREVNGRIVAVTLYERFTAENCEVHIASDGSRHWCTHGYLAASYAYPFMQLGLRRITGLVPANNLQALQFDLRMGFKEEGRMRQAMPGGIDLIILGMLRSECRFIPEASRHG